MKKITIGSIAAIVIIATVVTIIFLNQPEKPDYSGITLKVSSSLDLAGGSYLEGAKKFEEDYGCKVEFTNTFEGSDLFYSSGEDFSQCMPIDEYIDPKNKLYTKAIMDQSCTVDGKVYGVSHALLGRINYCTYDPAQFTRTSIPYKYYKEGNWDWNRRESHAVISMKAVIVRSLPMVVNIGILFTEKNRGLRSIDMMCKHDKR